MSLTKEGSGIGIRKTSLRQLEGRQALNLPFDRRVRRFRKGHMAVLHVHGAWSRTFEGT